MSDPSARTGDDLIPINVFTASFGKSKEDEGYDPMCDADGSGTVDVDDFHILRNEKRLVAAETRGYGMEDDSTLAAVIEAYDTRPGDERWNSAADLNHDNVVDAEDFKIAMANKGKGTSSP